MLADRLRITRAEAGRRVAEAQDLGQRRALTGEPLPARLSATAKAQRDGLLGGDHVHQIRGFFKRLPDAVDLFTREAAEADLASKASQYRPDQVAKPGTETAMGFRARNPTPLMRSYWPIWSAPTATTTAHSAPIVRRPTRSRCWPVPIRA